MRTLKQLAAVAVFLAAGIIIAGEAPPAGEAIKPEYKLQPGAELRYTITGTMQQGGPQGGDGKFGGEVRMIVCECDPKTGVMLLSSLGAMTIQMKAAGKDITQTQRLVSVSRMDRSGKVIQRAAQEKKDKAEKEDPSKTMARTMLKQFDQPPFAQLALPEKPVKPGDKWESEAGFMDLPIKTKAEASLVEVKTVEGRKHAVIKSTATGDLAGRQDADAPQLNSTVAQEALFDLERGLLAQSAYKVAMSFGPGGEMKMELGVKLDAVRIVPAQELAALAARWKAMDAAVALFYAGETDKGIEELQKQRTAEQDAEWQAGYDQLLSIGQNIKRFGNVGSAAAQAVEEEPKTPEEKALADAGAKAGEGNWKEAAAGYRAFADKYPEHKLAPQALVLAAGIYEGKLDDKASAEQARKVLVALREKSAAKEAGKDPLELYKLASSYAEAGDNQKAADAYRKFLASDSKDARMRVLAQYRLAGLFEKLGKAKEALEAYRAVDTIQSDDDYARQLKDKAKQKAAELGK